MYDLGLTFLLFYVIIKEKGGNDLKFDNCSLEDLRVLYKPDLVRDEYFIIVDEDDKYYYAVWTDCFNINGLYIPDLDTCNFHRHKLKKDAKCNENIKDIEPYVGELKLNNVLYIRYSTEESFKPATQSNRVLRDLIKKFFGRTEEKDLNTQIIELESKIIKHLEQRTNLDNIDYSLDIMSDFEFSNLVSKDFTLLGLCTTLSILYTVKEG